MAMYAVATTPLIQRLSDDDIKQIWFADDASAASRLIHIKKWWDMISKIGPEYGYYPNPNKTSIVVKEEHLEQAKNLFRETELTITSEGKRHLGSAIGPHSFVEY